MLATTIWVGVVAVILDLDPVSRAHLARALAAHAKWARANAIGLPADVVALADLASRSASARQVPTKSPGWQSLVTTQPMDAQLMDYDEAGLELGVSRRTVERLAAAGDLPTVRVRGAVRIRRTDLDGYVDGLDTRTSDCEEAS